MIGSTVHLISSNNNNIMPTETKYEQLYEQRHTGITCVVGPITPAVVDKLQDEIATIAATTKTYSYPQGQVFGHAASIIPEAKYRVLINDNTFTYASVADPGAYDPAALVPGISAAQREQVVAEHKRQQKDYENYIAIQQVSINFIIYALGEPAIAALKKPYVAYSNSTVHDVFDHLYNKTAEMMTVKDKQDYLNAGYATIWDGSTEMQTYFATIERHELSLPDRGLDVPTGRKVLAVGAMMWESGQFTSKQMHTWEKKPPADKTWDNIKDYFTEQWQEQQAYNKMTAKQSAFKEAAMLAKEAEMAEQNAQIFTLMQTQHEEQMKKIVENMAKMQAQYEGLLKQKNKENHNPNVPSVPCIVLEKPKHKPAVLLDIKPNERKTERSKCSHCKRWGWHKDVDCLELDANKDKRPDGYKPAAAVV